MFHTNIYLRWLDCPCNPVTIYSLVYLYPYDLFTSTFSLNWLWFFSKREGQKIRKVSSKSARIAIDWITLAFNINAYLHTIIEISLFVKLTYPLSSTTYQILMAKFDCSQLFYYKCNKSLVSLLLWFSFILWITLCQSIIA